MPSSADRARTSIRQWFRRGGLQPASCSFRQGTASALPQQRFLSGVLTPAPLVCPSPRHPFSLKGLRSFIARGLCRSRLQPRRKHPREAPSARGAVSASLRFSSPQQLFYSRVSISSASFRSVLAPAAL